MRSATGLTPESLLRATRPTRRLPGWARTLAAVLVASASSTSGTSGVVPFCDVFEPFLAHARQQFQKKARAAQNVLSAAAVAALEQELLEHLSLVASLAFGRMFYDFRFARAPFAAFEDVWLRQPRSTGIYTEFVAQLRGRGLIEGFERYPVLGRLLAQTVDFWVDTSARLCGRIAADLPRLRKSFGWSENPRDGVVGGIKTGLSDRHARGQTVAALTLATGQRVVYKPRSVRSEIAFNAFLSWLNERDLPLRLQTVRALDRGTYGWMEVVLHRACEDTAAVERFFTRSGMLLAVLHVLGVTDIHCENLIASGEYPIVVDLETLLSASPRRRMTVLDTGLLPRRPGRKESAIDASALGAEETPESDLRFPVWQYSNTDQMTLSEGAPRERGLHRVQLGNTWPNVAEHLSAFKEGFRSVYECLLANRRSLAADPVLELFNRLELRVLVRDSATYGRLHLHLLHPEFLEDGLDRSIELEWLARPLCIRTKPPRGRVRVYACERAAMERLDLPRFNTMAWREMRHDPATEEAKTFGGRRDAHTVRRRLAALSAEACRRQVGFIVRSVRLKYPAVSL